MKLKGKRSERGYPARIEREEPNNLPFQLGDFALKSFTFEKVSLNVIMNGFGNFVGVVKR
jgi:hypothetical protein